MLHFYALFPLIIVFLFSFCLTYLYKNWAIKSSILDIPNERSSHKAPVPRGGGIVIVLTFYFCLFYLYLKDQVENELFFAMLPGIVLALLGLLDDFKNLPPSIRFTFQFLCSGMALYFLRGFEGFFALNHIWFWNIIALVGFVWFINLFNFLDGSDGYASMETISIALILWYFTGMNVMLILVFSVAGFLYWNWPKAKVFMGDVGSTTLGYILIVFGVYLNNNLKLNFFFWLVITSLFWFDAIVTLFRRIINKEKLGQAHKNHMYQRAVQAGFSHLEVMLSGLGINVLNFIICIAIKRNGISYYIGSILVLAILFIALKYVDRRIPFKHMNT